MKDMKKLLTFIVLLTAVLSLFAQSSHRIVCFDNGWRFHLGDVAHAEAPAFDDGDWRSLAVPHDWSIEGENLKDNPGGGNVGYFPTGIGWYRRHFDVSGYRKDRLYTIEFDGVYMNSTVWLNGHCLGTWPYGYSSFSYDLTPYLKSRGNVLAVKVDNAVHPNSRWYTGSGIYRHVRMVETAKTHFCQWGVFNHTQSLTDDEATVQVQSDFVNGESTSQTLTIRHVILDAEGNVVCSHDDTAQVPAGGKASDVQDLILPRPIVWDLDNPYLYTLRSSLMAGQKILDEVENTLGVRTIAYPLDKGFLLNGQQVKMKGVNLHHDGGAVGAAVPERVWERRLEILKEGGCNAIRTSHNPPAPEFLDLCDRMGFLVMDEAFDQWITGKNEKDYSLYYEEWRDRDLTAMVARDRNHPSVVMWSIGNEIPDQAFPRGAVEAREMIALCHQLDPTRFVTSGNDLIAANEYPTIPEYLTAFENDIIGYNYPDRYRERRQLLYAIDKAEHPDRRIVATETGGLGGGRRQYRLPRRDAAAGTGPFRGFRGGGIINSNLIDVEHRWRLTAANDYVIGDFLWTGIDFYGESFWPMRGSTVGYLDNCGFKKDGYYFFKSIWTTEPVVHLFPHWNWEGYEGEIIQVGCFTNCDEVELFVNGKSYGRKSVEFPRRGVEISWNRYGEGKQYATTGDLHLVWDVEYQPGEIKAVGIKNGERIEEVIRTASAPAKLRLTADRTTFRAVPSDVSHLTVEVLDDEDNLCPVADNLVRFTVKGGELIGTENGNLGDLTSVLSPERRAWAGLCLGIVGASRPGMITVTVESEGLQPATVTLQAVK